MCLFMFFGVSKALTLKIYSSVSKNLNKVNDPMIQIKALLFLPLNGMWGILILGLLEYRFITTGYLLTVGLGTDRSKLIMYFGRVLKNWCKKSLPSFLSREKSQVRPLFVPKNSLRIHFHYPGYLLPMTMNICMINNNNAFDPAIFCEIMPIKIFE